jgi:peptidyl-prolyl cis-trans isomerase B (cyclophilin B)
MKKSLFYILGSAFLLTLASASGCSENVPEASKGERSIAVNDPEPATQPQSITKYRNVKVKITTPMGDMIAELYDSTPKHRDNFIKLAQEGYYNDLLFHRIIKNFMIQGGDPDSRGAAPGMRLGSGGPDYKVDAEIVDTLVHLKGALAAARQGDAVNPRKQSSGSQFYIVQGTPVQEQMLLGLENRRNARRDSSSLFKYSEAQIEAYKTLGGTPHLDGDYTVFGRIVEGLDVIDKIAAVETGQGDRPTEDVSFQITVIDE